MHLTARQDGLFSKVNSKELGVKAKVKPSAPVRHATNGTSQSGTLFNRICVGKFIFQVSPKLSAAHLGAF